MIESSKNKIIKQINSLKIKKHRDEQGLFIAEGLKFVNEIPDSWNVDFIAVSETFSKTNDSFMRKFKNTDSVYIIEDKLFDTVSDTKAPQGVLAVCHQKKFDLNLIMNNNNNFFIILDGLSDPGNLGTIIRTADACCCNAVFLSKGCVDIYNNKVLRSTMGSVFHVPIFTEIDLSSLFTLLKSKNISIVSTHLKGSLNIYEFNFKNSVAIVIGNEANGISENTVSCSDVLLKIPMPGKAESLNASVAASVIMYEALRQRLYLQ